MSDNVSGSLCRTGVFATAAGVEGAAARDKPGAAHSFGSVSDASDTRPRLLGWFQTGLVTRYFVADPLPINRVMVGFIADKLSINQVMVRLCDRVPSSY